MVSLKKIYSTQMAKVANLALSVLLVAGLCTTGWPLGIQTALAADDTTQLSAAGNNGAQVTTLGAAPTAAPKAAPSYNFTYTLDNTNMTAKVNASYIATVEDIPPYITVNGRTYRVTFTGSVTYNGVTYKVDTSRTNGCLDGSTSAYRAATIGGGVKRTLEPYQGYQQEGDPSAIRSIEVTVPLSKTFEANVGAEDLEQLVKSEQLTFDIALKSGGDGANVVRTDGGEGTEFTISVADLLDKGVTNNAGTAITYTLQDDASPWKIIFTEEGDYVFGVSELDNAAAGIDYDNGVTELTYHVVEEEGSLRVAEMYKEANGEVDPSAVSNQNVNEITVARLFDTKYALGTKLRKPPVIEKSGKTITMYLNEDTSGVITTQFTFDFSRSFELSGKLQIPDSDAVSLAFHGYKSLNAYRWDCNNGIDDFHFGNGAQKKQLTLLRYGYIPPNNDLNKGFLYNIMSRNLEDTWGWYAYKVENNVRVPYEASSGLNGDVAKTQKDVVPNAKSYETYKSSYEDNSWTNFSMKFICRDSSVGLGTLTITAMGKTAEFNNFNASDILGADAWQNAHFSLGASVQDGDKGGLQFLDEKYINEALNSATTSFWADRNHDGVYETQVNTTDSFAIPGESILVRHTLKSKNTSGNTYYENVLVRKLKDVDANATITGSDFASYPVGDTSKALQVVNASDAAFNTDDLTNAMRVAVFDNADGTNFEYKITAPSEYGHTVVEAALFGQPPFPSIQTEAYGFRTENKLEWETPSFTNRATVCNVTYNYNDEGATADKTDKALVGADYTVVAEAPEREGFTFGGWLATDADTAAAIISGSGSTHAGAATEGEETIYQPGDTIEALEGDVTLVAQWVGSGFVKLSHETLGAYADLTKEFGISITAPAEADLKLYDDADAAAAKKESTGITKKENADGTITYTGVKLANGENLYLESKPGMKVTFAETEADGYTTTAAVDGKSVEMATDHSLKVELPIAALDKASELKITDTMSKVPSTGILDGTTSWAVAALIGALALVAFGLFRLRTRRTH